MRCTVVGRRIFAARLDAPAGVDVLDWRDRDDLSHTPIDVPENVGTGLLFLMDELGLVFAAPDFVVDHDRKWRFVGDLNPTVNGPGLRRCGQRSPAHWPTN
ncbi:hypothetical protein [Saccharopolyspora hattusasensis]|uniref:hypothetical protein n=1 Tax=Saccharopolyspora hattusasensis TaxID=1128679 RepID=UPI003D9620AE